MKNEETKSKKSYTDTRALPLKQVGVILLLLWLTIIALSLLWNWHGNNKLAVRIARAEARATFDKDTVYRMWSASHGGVYVPITSETPPNPHLAHIKERDIETPSGRRLTLINPAYMTRQAHELGRKEYGYRGHITSLNPIRPENAPDPWEKQALESFEQGNKESTIRAEFDDGPYLRFMRPFVTQQGCLKCHGQQGYELGDIRGGISVSVPMAPYRAHVREQFAVVVWGHLLFFVLGVVAIFLGVKALLRREHKRNQAETKLRSSKQRNMDFAACSADRMWETNVKGEYTHLSGKVKETTGYEPDELLGKTSFDLMEKEEAQRVGALFKEIVSQKAPIVDLENDNITKDGRRLCLLTNGVPIFDAEGELLGYRGVDKDITEHKQFEQVMVECDEQFMNTFHNSIDATLLIEGDIFVECNAAAVRMLHADSKEQVLSTHPSQLSPETQPDGCSSLEKANEMIACAFEKGSNRFEWDHCRLDGEVFPVVVTLMPVSLFGKQQLYCMWKDISEQKQSEALFVESQVQMERMNCLMTGREQRVVEMKEEVNALLAELGREPKYQSVLQND